MDEDKNQLNPDPNATPQPEPINTMPEGVETFDPKQPAVSNINQRAEDQFVAKDIGFSTNTEEKTNSRYEGPVTQASYDQNEMTQSYNSTTSPVKKSHARQYKILALIILIILLIGVGALIFLTGDSGTSSSNSTSNESQAQQISEDQDSTEELPIADIETDDTEDDAVDEPVTEATPEQADATRRADINSVYQRLEEFFNENGYYPTDKFSETLFVGIDPENLLDSDGVGVAQQIQLGTTTPSSPYTAEKPVGSQYRYVAYKCTSSIPKESKCNSFVLFSWQETDPAGYSKASLN